MQIQQADCREFPTLLQLARDEGASSLLVALSFSVEGLPLDATRVLAIELNVNVERLFVMTVQIADEYMAFDADAFASDARISTLCMNQPWTLDCLAVEKPWGRELWYTGIEKRGVNAVIAQNGPNIPLPYLLQALGEGITGVPNSTPILLKILDPHPEPVYGDLYFEMHEKKQEVYIVTDVSQQAWPQGRGAIKIGFDVAKRSQYVDEAAFKRAFVESVKAYREVRELCDQEIDARRQAEGVALDAPVAAEQSRRWAQQLPVELQEKEQVLREAMDSFTAMHDVCRGDVVVIPRLLPHALQHGVRTVEFQTPHYERNIVSFAQKVLTQAHWDTEEAMAKCVMRDYQKPAFPCQQLDGVIVERIVDFEEFQAYRVQMSAGATLPMLSAGAYGLLMLIDGAAELAGHVLNNERSMLLGKHVFPLKLRANESGAVLLLAFPTLPTEIVDAKAGLWHNFAR